VICQIIFLVKTSIFVSRILPEFLEMQSSLINHSNSF